VTHLKIDYVELASRNIAATQTFLAKAFDWTFTDYGPEYQALANAGIDGGVFQSADEALKPPLVILKADDLAAAETAVKLAGGVITQPPFSFPGGRRFHFREPGGNEMAVWSQT
jgi:predicted enzyme related to lactoylglutathione lyase